MLRICRNCGKLGAYRHCWNCGDAESIPVQNRPEDRAPVEKRDPAVVVVMRPPRRMRPVYRRGKPPVFKPDFRRAA